MRALSIVAVVMLLLLGTVLLVLTVRAYRNTGNVAAVVYGVVLLIGMVSGAVGAWRNLRREKGERMPDA